MAEKKFGDIIISIIFGFFIIGAFSVMFVDWDSQYSNNYGIGEILNDSYENNIDDYTSTETELYQDTNNGSIFSLTTGSDVDVRGTSQAIKTTKNSPSIITNYLDDISGYIITNKLISGLIISLVVISSLILFIRFLRPGGA